jgi:hypothetical protein
VITDAEHPARNCQRPLRVRRAAQRVEQAVPQVLGAWPLVPPQGMARPQDTLPLPHRKEVSRMTVSVPLVVIFGILVYFAYRYTGLRAWQAIVACIFGFLLAATAAAPEIHSFLSGLINWLSKP